MSRTGAKGGSEWPKAGYQRTKRDPFDKRDLFDDKGQLTGGYDLGMARAYALEHAKKTVGESVGHGKDSRPLLWEVDKVGWDDDAECWEVVLSAQPARARVQQKGIWLYHVQPMGGLLPGTPLLRQELLYTLPKAKGNGRMFLALAAVVVLGIVGGGGARAALGRWPWEVASPPAVVLPTPTALPTATPSRTVTAIPGATPIATTRPTSTKPVATALPPATTSATSGDGSTVDVARVRELEAKVTLDPKDVESMQALGDLYFNAQRWDDAAKWYGEVLQVNPKNVNATLDLGTANFYLNRPDMAKLLWTQAITLDPKNVEAHFNLGILYSVVEPRDPDAAQREWQTVLELDPTSQLADIVRQHQPTPTPSR